MIRNREDTFHEISKSRSPPPSGGMFQKCSKTSADQWSKLRTTSTNKYD
jgi:hypothetical protein